MLENDFDEMKIPSNKKILFFEKLNQHLSVDQLKDSSNINYILA